MTDRIPVLGDGHCDLIDVMGNELRIVNAARVSLGKHSEKLNKKDIKLMKRLWRDRHTTPFEMVEFAFRVKVPIFIARQWHRHRTWSYNEVSRRYTSDDMGFFIPKTLRYQDPNNKQGGYIDMSIEESTPWIEKIDAHSKASFKLYMEMIDANITREQARMVLPQNMWTEYYAKVDLKNLLGFMSLRLDPHAQYEIRVYAYAMLVHIQKYVPKVVEVFTETLPFELDFNIGSELQLSKHALEEAGE